jgi:hypothetical protein
MMRWLSLLAATGVWSCAGTLGAESVRHAGRPLWVSSDIRHEGPSPTQGIVEITGPSGPIHETCKACKGTSPAYRALAPGEQLRVHADLWCFGWFLESGVYTARAIYSPKLAAGTFFVYEPEGRGGPPPPPEGVDLLTEDVVSDAVQFRVRALAP